MRLKHFTEIKLRGPLGRRNDPSDVVIVPSDDVIVPDDGVIVPSDDVFVLSNGVYEDEIAVCRGPKVVI
jgi:hypothetical protein